MRKSLSAKKIWGLPVAMGLLSIAGLTAALAGDGMWNAASWAALGVPTLASFWYLLRHKKS